jgi:hypothetical protein
VFWYSMNIFWFQSTIFSKQFKHDQKTVSNFILSGLFGYIGMLESGMEWRRQVVWFYWPFIDVVVWLYYQCSRGVNFINILRAPFASIILRLKSRFSEHSEIVLFQTFQKLRKNDVKLELWKSWKTRSYSKVQLKVWNAGPYKLPHILRRHCVPKWTT